MAAGDVAALKALKYRYLRTLDTKQWEEFADCFVPDATGDYGGLTFDTRDDLVAYLRANLGARVVTMHHVHHPEIDVTGDAATMRWYLHDKVIVPEHRFLLEGAAFYTDRCVRTDAGWKLAHTGYERTFEATYSLADLPSFSLKLP